jgi:hypothetical protein
MSADECGQLPINAPWPVCARPAGHDGRHESADFWWESGQTFAQVIGQQIERV